MTKEGFVVKVLYQPAEAGLPLGPLNPHKSLFKHLVPNVPKSQKVVPKVPISV